MAQSIRAVAMSSDKVTLSAVDRMLAEQACRDLVVQAAAFTDAQSHEDFAALFTEDGALIRPGPEHIQGQAAIIESYRSRPAGRITRHLKRHNLGERGARPAPPPPGCGLLWSGLASDAAGPFGRPAQARQVVGEFDDI